MSTPGAQHALAPGLELTPSVLKIKACKHHNATKKIKAISCKELGLKENFYLLGLKIVLISQKRELKKGNLKRIMEMESKKIIFIGISSRCVVSS